MAASVSARTWADRPARAASRSTTSSWSKVESTSITTSRIALRCRPPRCTAMSTPSTADSRARAVRNAVGSAPDTSNSMQVTGLLASRPILSMFAPRAAICPAMAAITAGVSGAPSTVTCSRPPRPRARSPDPMVISASRPRSAASAVTCLWIPVRSGESPQASSTPRTSRPRITTCSTSSTASECADNSANSRDVTPGRSRPVSVTSMVVVCWRFIAPPRYRVGRRLGGRGCEPRDVQDGAPVPPDAAIGPRRQAPPDLGVQAVTLRRRHRDVAGERIEQPDVLLRCVADLPIELLNDHDLERAAPFNLRAQVGHFSRPMEDRPGRQALADLVIDVLDLTEERVAVIGHDVLGSPHRKVPAAPQQCPGLAVLDPRIDPVPRGRGEDQVVAAGYAVVRRRWLPGLERGVDDPHCAKARQVAPGLLGEPGAELHTGDPVAAAGQLDGGLASPAPDLEQVAGVSQPGGPFKLVEQGDRVVGPGVVVTVGGRLERHAQAPGVGGHDSHDVGRGPLRSAAGSC